MLPVDTFLFFSFFLSLTFSGTLFNNDKYTHMYYKPGTAGIHVSLVLTVLENAKYPGLFWDQINCPLNRQCGEHATMQSRVRHSIN